MALQFNPGKAEADEKGEREKKVEAEKGKTEDKKVEQKKEKLVPVFNLSKTQYTAGFFDNEGRLRQSQYVIFDPNPPLLPYVPDFVLHEGEIV